MKPWLVIGATGRIGRALGERHEVIPVTRSELDLAGDVSRWRPPACDVAFLCAGISSMERCRRDQALSRRVNVESTIAVARKLLDRGALVVYLSSNQVFDGSRPRRRGDESTCPRSEYGRQKAEVEAALTGERVCIVRLTKVLAPGPPLLTGWHDALARGEVVRPFHDMVMAPIAMDLVVHVLGLIGKRGTTGVIHVSASADVSYAQVAQHLAARLDADASLVQPVSFTSAAVPGAEAPPHTSLATYRLERELGVVVPGVWDTIDDSLSLLERVGVRGHAE